MKVELAIMASAFVLASALAGLLGAVLYDPVLVSLGGGSVKIGIALAAFGAVAVWRVAPWIAVVSAALLGSLLEMVLFR